MLTTKTIALFAITLALVFLVTHSLIASAALVVAEWSIVGLVKHRKATPQDGTPPSIG